MLTPVSGYEGLTPGSNKKVLFDCSCGKRDVLKVWKYYKNGETTSCGACNILEEEHWRTTKYERLRLKHPVRLSKGSNKKVSWLCDCGGECTSRVIDVTRGFTKSCGRCNIISSENLTNIKYGKLRINEPKDISSGSHQKILWICDCGNKTEATVTNVVSGNTKSCGRCSLLSADYFTNRMFGSLKIKNPEHHYPYSNKKVCWICSCGKEKLISISSVVSGKTRSCGQCEVPSVDYWTTTKFGKLRLKNPHSIHKNAHKIVEWICDCGKEILCRVNTVTQKKRTSCGNCIDLAREWFDANKQALLKLKTPILPENIPLGYLKLEQTITNVRDPFLARCGLCGNSYGPSWQNVRRGTSLTCGCTVNRISSSAKKIYDFLVSAGEAPILEHLVGELKYDIAVPSKRLLIEFNGLRWHSQKFSKKRDLKKFTNAIDNHYDMISLFEDEYYFRPQMVHNLILNRLGLSNTSSLRPNKCRMLKVRAKEADQFYSKYHYIGACKAPINYAVYYGDQIIGCASFKKPSRQTIKHKWELARMVSHPDYRVHGIWSKILKLFCKEYKPESIISFSDNRLFTGLVYDKLGFKMDGAVPPDYYWVKGIRRYHKSALRRTESEKETGLTETELRINQGYRKIYDLGKTRWVIT
jgi:Probable Zinc-ribbon domain